MIARSCLLACALAVIIVPKPVGACGERTYDAVSDWLEASDDASRTGDFAAAISYANGARKASAALEPPSRAVCARMLAEVKIRQATSRAEYVAKHGRSPAAFANALRIAPILPKTFDCP